MKIILGMHRSGSSLVARLFFEVGADMGNPVDFYRADKWNPDGYYEQPDIHAINMPLINGWLWRFSYFYLPSTRTILKRAKHMSAQIRQTAECYERKVVKENRFCLTLPAWLEHGAKIDRLLVCLRDPIQVANSLQRRNKIPLRLAYSIWLDHNRRLLENAGEIPVWYVYYRNLLEADQFVDEIFLSARFFGIDVNRRQLGELREKIVNPGKSNSLYSKAIYPKPVQILWDELRARHSRQRNCSSISKPKEIFAGV